MNNEDEAMTKEENDPNRGSGEKNTPPATTEERAKEFEEYLQDIGVRI